SRVSWYSLSSPYEWFAENYSHYYRMSGNHPVADVKSYFDNLDHYRWTPSASSGTLAPSSEERPPKQGDESQAQAGDGPASPRKREAASGTGAQAPQVQRLPFSW